MTKQEAKRLGAWISLLGGSCFVLGAIAAVYIAFWMPDTQVRPVLTWLGRTFTSTKVNR